MKCSSPASGMVSLRGWRHGAWRVFAALFCCATGSPFGCVKRDAPLYVLINESKGELTDLLVVAGEHGAPGLEFRHARLEPGQCFVLGSAMPEVSIRTIKSRERSINPEFQSWPCCWNEVVLVHLKDSEIARLEYYNVGGDAKVDASLREYRAADTSDR